MFCGGFRALLPVPPSFPFFGDKLKTRQVIINAPIPQKARPFRGKRADKANARFAPAPPPFPGAGAGAGAGAGGLRLPGAGLGGSLVPPAPRSRSSDEKLCSLSVSANGNVLRTTKTHCKCRLSWKKDV